LINAGFYELGTTLGLVSTWMVSVCKLVNLLGI